MNNTLKLIVVIAGAAALPSCAARSLTGLEQKAPILEADSTRSVLDISNCLIKASDQTGATPSFIPKENGGTVTVTVGTPGLFGGGSMPMLYADITDTGTNRHVRISAFKTIWKGQNAGKRAKLAACL